MNKKARELFRQHIGFRLPHNLSPIIENLLKPHQVHLKYSLDNARNDNPKIVQNIHVAIVDKRAFNARAYSKNSVEMVGINAGVALAIPAIANWLLAHPDVFRDVGDPSKEEAPQPIDFAMLLAPGKVSEATLNTIGLPFVMPIDSSRRHYAAYMAALAWDFILFHEVAHVNRCHIQYRSQRVSSALPASSLDEFEQQSEEGAAALNRTLEVDADAVAGRIVVGIASLETRQGMFGPTDTSKIPWSASRAYEMWLRAVGILFVVMAIMDGTRNGFEPLRSHPHPFVRMQVMVNFIYPNWSKFIPDLERLIELTHKTSAALREIFEHGLLPKPSNLGHVSESSEFGKAVQYLWDCVHSAAPTLNEMTADRWKRINSE